jgi:hypothetical protein
MKNFSRVKKLVFILFGLFTLSVWIAGSSLASLVFIKKIPLSEINYAQLVFFIAGTIIVTILILKFNFLRPDIKNLSQLQERTGP